MSDRIEHISIDDLRTKFPRGLTFSNYKKSHVQKKLLHALYYQKLEESFFLDLRIDLFTLLSGNMEHFL